MANPASTASFSSPSESVQFLAPTAISWRFLNAPTIPESISSSPTPPAAKSISPSTKIATSYATPAQSAAAKFDSKPPSSNSCMHAQPIAIAQNASNTSNTISPAKWVNAINAINTSISKLDAAKKNKTPLTKGKRRFVAYFYYKIRILFGINGFDIELIELLRIDLRRRFRHHVGGFVRLREGNHVAKRIRPRQKHDHAIETKR